MKKLFVATFAFLFGSLLSAQVKNYVGIVRETHYPEYDDFLSELASSLKSRGYSTYAEYAEAHKKGGFGSGFVFVDSDGENYVITNRHVVSQAASASIEFENDDGSTKKYENLSVLITDDDIDLAILRFEGGAKPFKSALSISSSALSDGQDVVSAGFPALAGEPVWQFGKGSVTNAKARIKDLIDPAISTVIQHSAQVDAGNSGGPLLVPSKRSQAGYEVVGINTWKAAGRDSTNFALPASLALRLIEKAKKPADDSSARAERAQKLKEALTDSESDYTEIVKFVSYDLAAKDGEEAFDDILRHGSTKVRNRTAGEFAYSPIEGLRYAVASKIYEELSGENATDEALAKIDWKKEHGLFRIASVGGDEKGRKKDKKSEKSASSKKSSKSSGLPKVSWEGIEGPYLFALSGGIVIPFSTDTDFDLGNAFDFGLSVFPFNSGTFGFAAEFEHCTFEGDGFNAFGVGVLLRIPLNFDLFCISPQACAGIKIGFGETPLVNYYAEAGIETTFNLGIDTIRPCFGLAYRYATAVFSDYSGTDSDATVKSSNIVIRLGMGFSFE